MKGQNGPGLADQKIFRILSAEKQVIICARSCVLSLMCQLLNKLCFTDLLGQANYKIIF